MLRRNSWIEVLYAISLRMPGWITLLAASVVYVVLRFGPAYLDVRHRFLAPLEQVGPRLAPWIAGFILLVGAAVQIYKRSWRLRRGSSSGLEIIRALSWPDFEKRVSDAYRRQGYRVEKRRGDSKREVSLVLRRQGEVVLIQCQQWKAKEVGVSAVRTFYRVMAREQATLGILVTSGEFTPEARAFAKGKPLALVEGTAVLERIGQVQESKKKLVPQSSRK